MASTVEPSQPGDNMAMADLKPRDLEIQGMATQGTFSPDVKDKINSVKAGEPIFEEDTAGGMSRHLGVFSTTFLM